MITRARSRQISSTWCVLTLMDGRGIPSITAMRTALAPYVSLSYDQTRRLVTGDFTDLPSAHMTLEALCRVLTCHIGDIIPLDFRNEKVAFLNSEPKVVKVAKKRRDVAPVRSLPLDPSIDDIEPFIVDLKGFE